MKRNWDLFRLILDTAEKVEGGLPLIATKGTAYTSPHIALNLTGYDLGEVCEHMLLLGDAKLAKAREFGQLYEGTAGVAIDRLTMAGHDFLASARDNQRWEKAMAMVIDKGGTVTVGILSQILAALLKQSMGID